MGDDRLGTDATDAWQLIEFFGARRVYINQFTGLLGFAGRARRGGRGRGRRFRWGSSLRGHGRHEKNSQPHGGQITSWSHSGPSVRLQKFRGRPPLDILVEWD